MPPTFIVNCARSLTVPITLLYRRSLSEGVVPKIWKTAYITPIHKKGPKDLIENYRPISKLCVFAKVLEKVVYIQLYASLKHSLSEYQHGFISGRSTTSNLLICSEYLTKHMSEPAQVDIIYTDYSKAFDRIDHVILLQKLQRVGIRGNLFRWFSSYVHNRCQTVVLNGFTSASMYIPSGVPQGSLLGPLLFIIFVADISSCFRSSKILLYADDMKILSPIRSNEDASRLQEDLNKFQNYCIINKLDLNVSKCYVCSFTRKPIHILFNYTLKNSSLSRVSFIRDLGVTFDSKLLFNNHVNDVVSKASKALGFVLRMSSQFQSIKTLKILYCAYVRSHLEYASQVWNPSYGIYINRIEGIQRKFLRYLQYRTNIYLPDYSARCKKQHLLPLHERRRIADISYLLSLANGTIDCPELLGQLGLRTSSNALRKPNLLHIPTARSNYRQNSFLIRACRCYNSMSKNVDLDLFNMSVLKFKRISADVYFSGVAPV